MRKAFLESKWWFYIPVISILFINKMVDWAFESKDSVIIGNRWVIVTYTMFLHVLPLLAILTLIFK